MGEETESRAETGTLKGSRQVPVELLHPGRYQPRHSIDEELIEELAQSVRENGILQPLLVRRHPEQPDAPGDKVYKTVIPRNVRVSEAPSHGRPVIIYDLNCAGSKAYLELAGEVIHRERRLSV